MCQPCPVCGREALAVIDQKTSKRIKVDRMYRHKQNGRVWLHWIVPRDPMGEKDIEQFEKRLEEL